jgi:hypothetical protein
VDSTSGGGSDSRLRHDGIFRKVVIRMSWLWLIPVGIITMVGISLVAVISLGRLMIRHDVNKLIRKEMAPIEEEYRELCRW